MKGIFWRKGNGFLGANGTVEVLDWYSLWDCLTECQHGNQGLQGRATVPRTASTDTWRLECSWYLWERRCQVRKSWLASWEEIQHERRENTGQSQKIQAYEFCGLGCHRIYNLYIMHYYYNNNSYIMSLTQTP